MRQGLVARAHNAWRALAPRTRRLAVFTGAALLLGFFLTGRGATPPETPPEEERPVRVGVARRQNVPEYVLGLGTVTPVATVVVRSRIDGELLALHFAEGQDVLQGDLLAEIDPRPYEVRLSQAEGALARDQALLKDARLDLERYRRLVREGAVSPQQLQAQEALVGQYEGALLVDRATVAEARLDVSYCRITAPVSGKVGLRQVDVGNMIRASDAAGLVVITQMNPMQTVFTLVEKQIPDVLEAMAAAETSGTDLAVEAWDQENRRLLGIGRLLTLDNQIDTATGTVRAKAEFSNSGGRLFPNQFVNTRLLVRTLQNVLTIPSAAVQRGSDGAYVYTVDEARRVALRPVRTGYATSEITVVEEGLADGEIVVTDGLDRLRDGTLVRHSRSAADASS